ncbi:hypothetical protein LTR91_007743 [Friedmanniomyces endolithicus]|uniref:2-dehydropantoate 2-reductase n=1 Tax=Friedmanniomyces endolithicus TaxID=329885 RepID=A0AAN6QV53_9PEZI|nr:hypothetical protein LTR35_008599 [Friedmanniomyces endolithicus]KAK0287876.1 hypothetical protein LTS00_009721 [Friedmanniomyces endolithicus]KAK0310462.1 hypothetical protein LTR01_003614 [Friedmanniomyces endolithicus]KAK0320794.1 hypothetical protein LTR82_008112 [Friedmanniomyces endolithicus]KAK0828043.1 hypothetical protein LTR73_004996 [Friedmanniomyces endolithicus]
MPIRVLLVGVGAIGSFYGARLASAPHTLVSALCRSNYQAVREKGLKITSPIFGDAVFKPEYTFGSPAEARQAPVKFDYLFVATKALPDLSDDSCLLEGLVGEDTSIVLVQNGLGIEEPYRKRFPGACILSAITIASVAQPSPGHIKHNGWTRISIGPYVPQPDAGPGHSEERAAQSCSRLVELLKAGGISDAELHDHTGLQFVRWHKLAINTAMNPSSVLSGETANQAMLNDAELSHHLLKVMEEVLETAPKVLGKALPPASATPEQILESIKRNNSGSKPSMLLDWEKGSRMELEVILGNPIRMARKKGIEMPRLQTRIEKLRDQLVARFHTIVTLAAVSGKDRNNTAIAQYHLQTETAALITTAENAQSLIRQLQEMWLFGQLDTLGDTKARQQSDEDARSIALLLKQLAESQQPVASKASPGQAPQPAIVNGD